MPPRPDRRTPPSRILPAAPRSRPGAAPRPRQGRLLLLGSGGEAADGHVRLTLADHYRLAGGSGAAHRAMRRCADALLSEIRARGFDPDRLTPREMARVRVLVARRLPSLLAPPGG